MGLYYEINRILIKVIWLIRPTEGPNQEVTCVQLFNQRNSINIMNQGLPTQGFLLSRISLYFVLMLHLNI